MRAEDLAYAAGFLDGEGSFLAASSTVKATNTYKPVLDWMALKFGGTVNSRVGTIKPAFVWVLCGQPAADLCVRLLPYLQEKKSRASALIFYRSTIGKRGRKLSDTEIQTRKEILSNES